MSSLAAEPLPDHDRAQCATHPGVASVAICARCGDYQCAQCHKLIAGRALCARCRMLPGVDYLEDTRQRFWGKRDGFVWYLGLLGSLQTLGVLPSAIQTGDLAHVVQLIAWLGVLLAYFALYRPMRLGLIAITILDIIADAVRAAVGLMVISTAKLSPGAAMALQALGGVVGLLIAIAAYRSPRNKLAFKISVDDRELRAVYDRYLSNPLATRSVVYGLLGMLVPFSNLVTLVMGIRALRVASTDGWPPRGGRRAAQIGIAFSILGLLAWASFVAIWVLRRSELWM